MPEFLRAELHSAGTPLLVLARLVGALLLGAVVAWIYRRTRPPSDSSSSLSITLVLLAVLIAMVTQVIGDNVARAFSLVGALSIVRFRTVVRDTVDTAFVIFAVAVGMAAGASHPSVALSGLFVVGIAAWLMSRREPAVGAGADYVLAVRLGLGHDAESALAPAMATHGGRRKLMSIETARQGLAIEVRYRIEIASERSAAALVKAVNLVESVQSVSLNGVVAND